MNIYLFLLLSLFLSLISIAQTSTNRIDSLKQLLTFGNHTQTPEIFHALAEAYTYKNPDSSYACAHRLQDWSSQRQDDHWQGMAAIRKAWVHKHNNMYDSTIHYTRYAFEYLQRVQEPKEVLLPLIYLCKLNMDMGNYNTAKQQCLRGLRIADSLGAVEEQVDFLSDLGYMYTLFQDSVYALQYLERAYRLAKQLDRTSRARAGAMHDLGLAYHSARRYEEAISIFKSYLAESHAPRSKDSSRTYTNIARSYIDWERYDSARYYLDAGRDIRRRLSQPDHNAYAYKEYATLFRATKEYELSAYYGLKVAQIGEELDHIGHLEDGYRNLRDTYLASGDYRESAEYGIKYSTVKDRKYDMEKLRLMEEMDAKYMNSMKEREIERLEAQQKLAQRTQTGLLVGIALVVVIALLVIVLLRFSIKRQKAQRQLADTQLSLKEQQLEEFRRVLQEKNKVLGQVDDQLGNDLMDAQERERVVEKLTRSMILTEDDWRRFKTLFENVHGDFFSRLKEEQQDLTKGELRILALMRLGLSTREISRSLGISPDSVSKAKYRLKKKLGIQERSELEQFVESF